MGSAAVAGANGSVEGGAVSGVASSSVDFSRLIGGETITDGWIKDIAGFDSCLEIFGCLSNNKLSS